MSLKFKVEQRPKANLKVIKGRVRIESLNNIIYVINMNVNNYITLVCKEPVDAGGGLSFYVEN